MFSAGDYNATQEIYRGGKSLIYRGKRQKDNLPVILKVLNQDSPSAEERARFKTEYFFTQKVEGKGIIGVHDLLELQRTLAIVVEDFGGVSLSERLRQGSLSLEDFLETAIKITKSLAAIHEQNVLHKDINPSNIIVNPDDKRLKIIDFGISTKLPKESPLAKSPSTLEGTLPYISPEQTGRMNRSLDYRTDLYSLGITFYEMLMGFRPFQSQDQMELIHCHLAKAPRPPIELNDKIPKILSDLILKLLEKNAEDRYQTSRGLIKDLQRCKELLKPNGTIQNFELAHFDASGKFQIPEKLYGRGKEIESLLNAFENVSGGAKELILVKGFSGIGKTALVNEIQKPIARQRGYFISGKFDQFQRTVPYISLIEAFSSMVRQILSESEEEVNLWKTN